MFEEVTANLQDILEIAGECPESYRQECLSALIDFMSCSSGLPVSLRDSIGEILTIADQQPHKYRQSCFKVLLQVALYWELPAPGAMSHHVEKAVEIAEQCPDPHRESTFEVLLVDVVTEQFEKGKDFFSNVLAIARECPKTYQEECFGTLAKKYGVDRRLPTTIRSRLREIIEIARRCPRSYRPSCFAILLR